MSAPSAYALEQAVATMQRALAGEHDEDGVRLDPQEATGNVEELLARVLRAAVEADAMEEMAHGRANDMMARAKRYGERASNFRQIAVSVMEVLGERRVELPDLTASIKRNSPRVVITDEDLLPPELTRTTVTPDKQAIKDELAKGPVPGATLSNASKSLSIRTR